MAIVPLSARDHRIDILRALALLSIFINHIPGNVLEPYTHKNFGFSDSAEAFVMLAGIASAFAYFPAFAAGKYRRPLSKIGSRAVTLYVAHLASIVVGIGIYCYAELTWSMPVVNSTLNVAPIINDPMRGFVGLVLLTMQIGYHNILPLYVCLLLFLPVLMTAARLGLAVLATLSLGLWLLTHFSGINLPDYPGSGKWFFNPFGWQVVYAAGFFAGVRILNGRPPVPYRWWLWWPALGYLVAACLYNRYHLYGVIPDLPGLPHSLQANEKSAVALPRLLHLLSLAYVIGYSRIMVWLGRMSPAGPLALIGRHSLPVFWLGTALAVVGQVMTFVVAPGPFGQLAYIAAGILAQWLLAVILDGIKGPSRAPSGAAVGASAPAPASAASQRLVSVPAE